MPGGCGLPSRTELGFVAVTDDVWKDSKNTGSETVRAYQAVNRRKSKGSGSISGELGESFRRIDRPSDQSDVSLERVLQNEETMGLLAAFLEKQLCLESLLFWIDVEAFQNSDWKASRVLGISRRHRQPSEYMTPPQIRRGRKLFPEQHDDGPMHKEAKLEDDGLRQICLDGKEMESLTELIKDGEVDRKLFRSAQRSVFRDLENGVFPSFLEALNKRGLRRLKQALDCAPANAPSLATANALTKKAEEA